MLQATLQNRTNETVVRNTLSAFRSISIPEEIEDELYFFAMQVLESKDSPIALRSFALWVCYRIALRYPDLQFELLGIAKITLETYGNDSPGVKSSAARVVKLLTERFCK